MCANSRATPDSAPSLPTLSHDELAVLGHYLSRRDQDLPSLAAHLNLSLTRFLELATSPAVLAHLKAFYRYTRIRERSRQSAALAALSDDLTKATDPVERRRTAIAILRASHNLLHAPAPRPPRRKPTRHLPDSAVELEARVAQLMAIDKMSEDRRQEREALKAAHPRQGLGQSAPLSPAPTYIPPVSTTGPIPITFMPPSTAGPLRPMSPIRPKPSRSSAFLASAAGAPP